jgi:hypothetical protein
MGASNPHDIQRVLGEKELQKYLVIEIEEVYPAAGGRPAGDGAAAAAWNHKCFALDRLVYLRASRKRRAS